MDQFLWNYIDTKSQYHGCWMAASIDTSEWLHRGKWDAHRLHEWCCAFIEDSESLPFNIYGTWNHSKLDYEDFWQDIFMHLQSIGKFVAAHNLVLFTTQESFQKCYGLKKAICKC